MGPGALGGGGGRGGRGGVSPWPGGTGGAEAAVCVCQVVPAGGSSTICISFTPVVLGPDVLHKVECTGSALGSMSLDDEVSAPGLGRAPTTASPWGSSPTACSARAPVIGLVLGRWRGSFRGGGAACRARLWDP